MNIYNTKTTLEKLKDYNDDIKIDSNYLEEWRNVRTLLTDEYFEDMLKNMNISKKKFSYSLQPGNKSEDSEEWVSEFYNIINDFYYNNINYKLGVYLAIQPFSVYLQEKINRSLKTINNIEVCEKVKDVFIENHLAEMFNIIGKIIAWKLEEYKRSTNYKEGITLDSFLRDTFFSKDSFLDFYSEFPVAARICTTRTTYLYENYIDILSKINSEHDEIKNFLNTESLKLTDVTLSTGDSHDKGKSVAILDFNNKKLVYKPKNLKICETLSDFLDWCAQCNNKLLDLKIPKGIYKENHSYVEFINFKSCNNLKEVSNYYTRYGYLIALCYLLNLNDLHVENVIAHGEYPVIIDIETIFQVPVSMEDETLYTKLLKELELESVSSSLLLPTNLSFGLDDKLDLSALSGKLVELKQKILAPKYIDSSDFRYEKTESYFPGGDNIPKLNKVEEVDYKNHILDIVSGYDDFIKFTVENKESFIKKLNDFRNQKVRVLLKGTEKYASMIRYSNHPNYNREMKYRERLLMNLWAYPYKNKEVVKSEIEDLIFNDIPIFYSYPNSRDIVDSKGNTYVNYLSETGIQKSIDRIKNIDSTLGKLQRTILISSLGISDEVLNHPATKKNLIFNNQNYDFLKESNNVAQRLIENMIDHDDNITMLNIDCTEQKKWKIVPLDESLYGGLSGLAVFFLKLYIETNNVQYLTIYRNLIKTAIIQCKSSVFLSAFTGWLSPIYPLMIEKKYLNSMEDEEFFNITLEKLANMTQEQISAMERMDYISGKSSIIFLLIQAREISHNHNIKKAIDNFSDNFVNDVNKSDFDKVGIAHGISGIMLVAAQLNKFSSEFIKKQLSKEYSLINFDEKSYKWCWGIPGMIQARLKILEVRPESIDLLELESLITEFRIISDKMINDDSLCHGNGSLITTMKMLLDYTNDKYWKNLIERYSSNIFMYSLVEDYAVPRLGNIELKGLIDGLCGIGWIYLYINKSKGNVLLLEI
ncbi:type 2 lanthipeptide synthetase LanM [Staphylococcus agnetis]|uniref:type 2 lanthipeptide synthetase LanM n=1 Tax=Staphylococcus agnetis TaxID=985762 RepID=UPI000D035A9A|nr:type 2 lanthipeptide synthetase LanM [Staphylococcus agnetis]